MTPQKEKKPQPDRHASGEQETRRVVDGFANPVPFTRHMAGRPSVFKPHDILQLQQTIGNRATRFFISRQASGVPSGDPVIQRAWVKCEEGEKWDKPINGRQTWYRKVVPAAAQANSQAATPNAITYLYKFEIDGPISSFMDVDDNWRTEEEWQRMDRFPDFEGKSESASKDSKEVKDSKETKDVKSRDDDSEKEKYREEFEGARASIAHWASTRLQEIFQEALKDPLKGLRTGGDAKIVEIGSGFGFLAGMLAEQDRKKIIQTEVDKDVLRARSLFDEPIREMGGEQLCAQFGKGSLDAVVAVNVLDTLSTGLLERVIESARDALKDEGLMIHLMNKVTHRWETFNNIFLMKKGLIPVLDLAGGDNIVSIDGFYTIPKSKAPEVEKNLSVKNEKYTELWRDYQRNPDLWIGNNCMSSDRTTKRFLSFIYQEALLKSERRYSLRVEFINRLERQLGTADWKVMKNQLYGIMKKNHKEIFVELNIDDPCDKVESYTHVFIAQKRKPAACGVTCVIQ